MLLSAYAIAGLGYGLGAGGAGAATDLVGRAVTGGRRSRPQAAGSPTPAGGLVLTIRFHLPGKPLPGDTVLYSFSGPRDYVRSEKQVSESRTLEIPVDRSGDKRIWLLIDNKPYSRPLTFHDERFDAVDVP